MATNATYKIWNGSQWIEYHFKTNADQVTMTTGTGWKKFVSAKVTVNGVAFVEGSETGSAQVTINGSHISWFNGTKPSTNYLANAATIQAALQALDTAAKSAYDHVPANCLTYGQNGNFHTYLDSVYQPYHALLVAIANLTTSTGLIRISEGNASVDNTSYVPDTRTVNGKRLNGNITLSASDIKLSNNDTVEATFYDIVEYAHGKANAKVISYSYSGSYTNIKNSKFNSSAATITLSGSEVICDDFNNDDVAQYGVDFFKKGDVVYVKELNVPDRWVSNITYTNGQPTSVEFSILETTKVDLSNYQTKQTTLAGYGITDAKINGNTITLGSTSITVITDISGKADKNHASSATTYGVGTSTNYGHVKLGAANQNGATAADGVAAPNGHTHSQYLTSHQSLTEYPKIFVQNAQPTASKSGDLWIQIPA